MLEFINNEFDVLVSTTIIESGLDDTKEAATLLIDAINASKKILWCGNGGSAADAQHLATELMGSMSEHDRKPIPLNRSYHGFFIHYCLGK